LGPENAATNEYNHLHGKIAQNRSSTVKEKFKDQVEVQGVKGRSGFSKKISQPADYSPASRFGLSH
jgi:hypothetical protein